ncbi:hypothetical protein BCR32DRAFT_286203 [Anaeromyces robustus]|uniref:L domain-like protein n=1 Tax=Anaeromyces robustus TaxID=1754192 RepID=A0A1Y1W339_9FUNG|nr:hypothetical protein BCR32DRAFT_286203 [Anaeromyces robustus]|eukprot:ORX67705.1 hypothetical protein BCR32DRAFT_286203 [Anaeromyces robustus]
MSLNIKSFVVSIVCTNLQNFPFEMERRKANVFSRNRLTILLRGINNLTNLKYLNLSFNQMTTLLPEINMENNFTILPPEIDNIINLKKLKSQFHER